MKRRREKRLQTHTARCVSSLAAACITHNVSCCCATIRHKTRHATPCSRQSARRRTIRSFRVVEQLARELFPEQRLPNEELDVLRGRILLQIHHRAQCLQLLRPLRAAKPLRK